MKIITNITLKKAQNPPVIIAANIAAIPAKINLNIAIIKAPTNIKISHPAGKSKQSNKIHNKIIKKFFICV